MGDATILGASAPEKRPKDGLQTWELWDAEYAAPGLTDWEMLPAGDMAEVMASVPDLAGLKKGLEIGCGRAIRTFVTLLTTPELNRPDFQLIAIDQCPNAILGAHELATRILDRTPIAGALANAILPFVDPQTTSRLQAKLSFQQADLFKWLDNRANRFDLVIDWMCFHEVPLDRRMEYARKIADASERYFIIKLFSREGSSVEDLGEVAGMPKFQFSEADIRQIFGTWFDIVSIHSFPENLTPVPTPSDGIVAAKRAYVLRHRDWAQQAAPKPCGAKD